MIKKHLNVNQKIILLKIQYIALISQSNRIKIHKYLKKSHTHQTILYHMVLNYRNHIVVKLIDQIRVYKIQFKKIFL